MAESVPDGFYEWYRERLGHRHIVVQGALWFLCGYIWIPLWHFYSGASEFRVWYRDNMGHRHVVVQAALWFLYGFIWIQLWHLNSDAIVKQSELTSPAAGMVPGFGVESERNVE